MALPNCSHCSHKLRWRDEVALKWWGKKPSSASICSPQAKGPFKFLHLTYMNHFKVPFLHFHLGQVSDLLLADFPQGPTLLTSSQTRSRHGCLAEEGTVENWPRPAPLPSAKHLPQVPEPSSSRCLKRGWWPGVQYEERLEKPHSWPGLRAEVLMRHKQDIYLPSESGALPWLQHHSSTTHFSAPLQA